MAGAAMRHMLIGGIGRMTTGIARGRADHALDLVKIGLDAPETTTREGRNRGALRLAPLPGGGHEKRDQEQRAERDRATDACYLTRHAALARFGKRMSR